MSKLLYSCHILVQLLCLSCILMDRGECLCSRDIGRVLRDILRLSDIKINCAKFKKPYIYMWVLLYVFLFEIKYIFWTSVPTMLWMIHVMLPVSYLLGTPEPYFDLYLFTSQPKKSCCISICTLTVDVQTSFTGLTWYWRKHLNMIVKCECVTRTVFYSRFCQLMYVY